MSGIAGILDRTAGERACGERVQAMLRVLRHRGGDSVELHACGPAAVGQCSSTVLDGADTAPAKPGDGSLFAVFDGDITNAAELSDGLGAAGGEPSIACPADLVLRLYNRYGHALPGFIEGSFALAVYDAREGTLFLARDHAGGRPLHFLQFTGGFCFASEIKALWTIPGVRPSLSDAGLLTYFAFTQSPAPYTVFEGVRKLVPGHSLTVTADGEARMRPYWRLQYVPKMRSSFGDAVEALREKLSGALARGESAAFREGVALSGGVDSSVVTGLMSQLHAKPVPTFTIGAGTRAGAVDPELARAEAVAAQHATEHHAWDLDDVTFDDVRSALRAYDEPIGIFDAVHYLRLFGLAKDHARGVITGNGADSLFTGSATFGRFRRRTLARQFALGRVSVIAGARSRRISCTTPTKSTSGTPRACSPRGWHGTPASTTPATCSRTIWISWTPTTCLIPTSSWSCSSVSPTC